MRGGSRAFIGVENKKILLKMAEGKISAMKGLDHMGRTTESMVGGLTGVMNCYRKQSGKRSQKNIGNALSFFGTF